VNPRENRLPDIIAKFAICTTIVHGKKFITAPFVTFAGLVQVWELITDIVCDAMLVCLYPPIRAVAAAAVTTTITMFVSLIVCKAIVPFVTNPCLNRQNHCED
jgi:hypothetical protein